MSGALEAKVALVTGAARGVGEATARRFVAEGARVVIADVRDELGRALGAELGSAARYEHLDVTAETSWAAAMDGVRGGEGHLDVLVNNAGILRLGTLLDTDPETFLEVVRVNELGPFLGMRAAAPLLIEAGGGSIVNVSSTQGLEGFPGLVAYVASKFALTGMTKAVALELAQHGVRVNSVHPTGIRTPMLAEAFPSAPPGAGAAGSRIPMGRLCTPEEVAALICFLASDEASMSTGGQFVIDGGSTAGPH
jgi:3alpha(or 20beta)-hydroxysteroid dehydrogenase